MGCLQNRPQQSRLVSNQFVPIESLNLKAPPIPLLSRIRSKTSDFQISFSDFCLEKPSKIDRDYTLLNPPIGKGGFGIVRRGIHKKSGLQRAVKIIPKEKVSETHQKRLLNEINILKKLDHPNIIKVFEFYQDDNNIYIVNELCTGGELYFKLVERKKFSEEQCALILKQILSAIFNCHENNIVHRDIKPENILFEKDNDDSLLKIIDFGTAIELQKNDAEMNEFIGTPYYMAPEILLGKYDSKVDIWSCGVLLYLLLSGHPPFSGASKSVTYQKIMEMEPSFPAEDWSDISDETKSFILRLLQKNAEKRPSADEAIKDDFFEKHLKRKETDELMKRALKNLLEFHCDVKLQEFTWMFFVNNFANNSEDEKNEILLAFQSLDLNGDGRLNRQELIEGYKKHLGKNKEVEEKVEKIFSLLDTNGNGNLDYSEFLIGTINQNKFLTDKRLKRGFRMFDKDDNGSINLEELKEVFGGDKISDEDWKEIIKEVDENGDGEISFMEFVKMMNKLLNN